MFADSEVSSVSSVSIKASTPVTISPHTFESCISPPVPCSAGPSFVLALSSKSPPRMSSFVEKEKQVDSVVKSKNWNFITRMIKTLDNLEIKYHTASGMLGTEQ